MNNKYYYLRTDIAKNNGLACMVAVEENPIYNYREFFNLNHSVDVVEFIGEYVPSNITYIEESHCIREATKQESYKNGNYKLTENEYIKDGVVKNIPPVDMSLAKPVFNEELEIWVDMSTLEESKEFKRLELKNARDTEILSHYLYTNNHIYDANLDSRNRLFQAQQLGVGTETNINWVTADNQISSVNNQDLNNIVNGIAYREQLAFNKFSVKYTEVLNCTNIDDVKNIKY